MDQKKKWGALDKACKQTVIKVTEWERRTTHWTLNYSIQRYREDRASSVTRTAPIAIDCGMETELLSAQIPTERPIHQVPLESSVNTLSK